MNCSKCGTENADGNAFCISCGAPLLGAQGSVQQPELSDTGPESAGQVSPVLPRLPTAVSMPARSRNTFLLLGIFLGTLGIHNFYAGYKTKGFIQLAITLATGWTCFGLLVTFAWSLFEAFSVKEDASGNPFQ